MRIMKPVKPALKPQHLTQIDIGGRTKGSVACILEHLGKRRALRQRRPHNRAVPPPAWRFIVIRRKHAQHHHADEDRDR